MQKLDDDTRSLSNFINVLHSPDTERTYVNSLKIFRDFCKVSSYDDLLQLDTDTTFNNIKDFIIFQSRKLGKSYSRVLCLCAAIRLFYIVNRYKGIDWELLSRYKGIPTKKTKDRIFKKNEIQKLLDLSDLRMKVVILTMLSSGMRVGGLAGLKYGDLTYIEDKKIYRFTVYSDSPKDEYYTYCTPECANYIRLYFEDRQQKHGEILESFSPFIRTDFDSTTDLSITAKSIQQRLRILIIRSGLRKKGTIRKRSEIMTCHAFRKYFNTVCIDKNMNFVSKELLMGHKKDLGLERSYYRPGSDTLLNEYLRVINDLTISDEFRLKIQVTDLKERLQESETQMRNELKSFAKILKEKGIM